MRIVLPFLVRHMYHLRANPRGDVDKAGGWMERHRIPVVGPVRLGRQELRVCIGYAGEFDRATGLRVDSVGPGDPCNERRGGEELAGLAVEHVEEAVFVRLKDDFARVAV